MTKLIKLKSAVGTTWAGRIMHNQSKEPAALADGRVDVTSTYIETSRANGRSLIAGDFTFGNITLYVYSDSSAILVDENRMVLPALLYIPERVTFEGKKYFLSLHDITNPQNSARFVSSEQALRFREAFFQDCETLIAKVLKIKIPDNPWFMAQDTRGEQDAQRLTSLMYGLEQMSVRTLDIKGRMLKTNGQPGPIRLEEKRSRSTKGVSEAKAWRDMFEHPAFPVPVQNQVHQGWDRIRSGTDALVFTGLNLADAPLPESAHAKTHALSLAQKTLETTNTKIEDLNSFW